VYTTNSLFTQEKVQCPAGWWATELRRHSVGHLQSMR
jgi:hypothetical protein